MSKENNKAGQDNVFKVLRNRKVVSDKLNKANALKAWQDGSLVNNDVLKKMSKQGIAFQPMKDTEKNINILILCVHAGKLHSNSVNRGIYAMNWRR